MPFLFSPSFCLVTAIELLRFCSGKVGLIGEYWKVVLLKGEADEGWPCVVVSLKIVGVFGELHPTCVSSSILSIRRFLLTLKIYLFFTFYVRKRCQKAKLKYIYIFR